MTKPNSSFSNRKGLSRRNAEAGKNKNSPKLKAKQKSNEEDYQKHCEKLLKKQLKLFKINNSTGFQDQNLSNFINFAAEILQNQDAQNFNFKPEQKIKISKGALLAVLLASTVLQDEILLNKIIDGADWAIKEGVKNAHILPTVAAGAALGGARGALVATTLAMVNSAKAEKQTDIFEDPQNHSNPVFKKKAISPEPLIDDIMIMADLNKYGDLANLLHIYFTNNEAQKIEYLRTKFDREELRKLTLKEDDVGNNPIHLAAFRGHSNVIKFFEDWFGKDWLKTAALEENKDNDNAIHLAAYKVRLDVIKDFEDWFGKDWLKEAALKTNKKGNNAIHLAVDLGHSDVIKHFEGSFGKEWLKTAALEKNNAGDNAIHLAAYLGRSDVIKDFEDLLGKEWLKTSALKKTESGDNAIHLAAYKGHLDVIKDFEDLLGKEWLKEAALKKNNNGNNAINLAEHKGDLDLIKYFEDLQNHSNSVLEPKTIYPEPGIDGRASGDHSHLTKLQSAILQGNVEMVRDLIKRGADVNLVGHMPRLPIMLAMKSSEEMVKILLESENLKIDEQDSYGQTALMFAIYGPVFMLPIKIDSLEAIVEQILKKNPDLNIKDGQGKTALDIARELKIENLIALIEQHQSQSLAKQQPSTLVEKAEHQKLENFPEPQLNPYIESLRNFSFPESQIFVVGDNDDTGDCALTEKGIFLLSDLIKIDPITHVSMDETFNYQYSLIKFSDLDIGVDENGFNIVNNRDFIQNAIDKLQKKVADAQIIFPDSINKTASYIREIIQTVKDQSEIKKLVVTFFANQIFDDLDLASRPASLKNFYNYGLVERTINAVFHNFEIISEELITSKEFQDELKSYLMPIVFGRTNIEPNRPVSPLKKGKPIQQKYDEYISDFAKMATLSLKEEQYDDRLEKAAEFINNPESSILILPPSYEADFGGFVLHNRKNFFIFPLSTMHRTSFTHESLHSYDQNLCVEFRRDTTPCGNEETVDKDFGSKIVKAFEIDTNNPRKKFVKVPKNRQDETSNHEIITNLTDFLTPEQFLENYPNAAVLRSKTIKQTTEESKFYAAILQGYFGKVQQMIEQNLEVVNKKYDGMSFPSISKLIGKVEKNISAEFTKHEGNDLEKTKSYSKIEKLIEAKYQEFVKSWQASRKQNQER